MIATESRGEAAPRPALPVRSRVLFLALVLLLAALPAVGLAVTTGGWSDGYRSGVTVTDTDTVTDTGTGGVPASGRILLDAGRTDDPWGGSVTYSGCAVPAPGGDGGAGLPCRAG